MTSEQSTKPRRGRPPRSSSKYAKIGANYWTTAANSDGPDLPLPDTTEPRPYTEDEAVALVAEYCRRPSARTETGRITPQVAYETSSILCSPYFMPAIMSGLRGDKLVRTAVDACKDAPRSYTLHYLSNVFLRFCKHFDFITAKQLRSWREKIPSYKPATRSQDLVMTPEDLRLYFNHLADRCAADPNNYARWRDYFAASLGLLTGCREGQILRLRWPFDVEVKPESITFYFVRQKSSHTAPQVHNISPATALPSGQPFSYVWSNLLANLPPGSTGLYVGTTLPPKRPAHIQLPDSTAIIGRKVTMRSLRATAASVVANLVGIMQAKEMLGHTSIKTTMHYVNTLPVNRTAQMSATISQYSANQDIEEM